MNKKQYRIHCGCYTMWLRKVKLPNHFTYDRHIDHKYSVEEGFKNSIPLSLINNIKNLRVISKKKNQDKNCKCSISLDELNTFEFPDKHFKEYNDVYDIAKESFDMFRWHREDYMSVYNKLKRKKQNILAPFMAKSRLYDFNDIPEEVMV